MNFLFLDDNAERCRTVQRICPFAVITQHVAVAIQTLQTRPVWDLVSLDHDLGEEVYVDSRRPDCGMEVVRWMVAHKPAIREIICHSHNERARQTMVKTLTHAGYQACAFPFAPFPYALIAEVARSASSG
jgi:hypothetical protein